MDESSGYSDLDFVSDGENDEHALNESPTRRRKSALAANHPRREARLLAMENALCEAEELRRLGVPALAAFRKVLAIQDEAGEEEACCYHAWRAAQSLCVLLVEKCVAKGGDSGSGDGAAELFRAFRRFLRDSTTAAVATRNQVEQGVDEILGASLLPLRVFGASVDVSIIETLHGNAIEVFAPVFSRLCQKIRLRLGYAYYEMNMFCRLASMLPDLPSDNNNDDDDANNRTNRKNIKHEDAAAVSTLALHMAVSLSQGEHRRVQSLYHDALRMQSCASCTVQPRVMGIVRECFAILSLRERRYFDAHGGFWEAFKCFNRSGDDVQRVRCLKSLVLSEMLKRVYSTAGNPNRSVATVGKEDAQKDDDRPGGVDAADARGSFPTCGVRELLGATPEAQPLVGRDEMLKVFALSEAVASNDVLQAEKLCEEAFKVLDPRLGPCARPMLAEMRSRQNVIKRTGAEGEKSDGEGQASSL